MPIASTYYGRYNVRIAFAADVLGSTVVTGAISEIVTTDLDANRALISDASGKIITSSTVTSTELSYIAGVTSSVQTQLDAKEGTVTKGDITEDTSSVLTITGGTNSIIGSGVTIEVAEADASTSGYLTSSDWNTFNGKLGTSLTDAYVFVGNGSNIAAGVAISGDITLANDGTVAIASGVIVDADVNASAAITRTKLATGTAYRILANNASGVISENAAITASRAVVSDSNGQLTASSVTTTELGYVSGLTSALQTQLDELIAGNATSSIVQTPTASQHLYSLVWDNNNSQWDLQASGSGGSLTGPGSSTDNAIVRWDGTGGTATQDSSILIDDSDNITGVTSITVDLGGLHLLDTDASHDLIITVGSDLTADRTLTLTTGDSDRTITLSGNPTLGDWFDQSVKAAASVAFADVTVTNAGGLHILDSDASHDLIVTTSSNLTADRTLTLVPGDANRTLTINASGTVYVTGGTDVALADGGTGASLSDPGADRIMFWDDSAGAVTWLTAGNWLTLSGTDLEVGGTASSSMTIDSDYDIQFSRFSDSGNDYARVKLEGSNIDLYYFNGNVAGTETYESLLRFGGDIINRWSRSPGIAMLTHLGKGYDTDSSLDGFHVYGTTGGYYASASDIIFRIQADKTVTLNLGSDARGDIYARNSSGDFDRIAKGSEGTIFRAGTNDPAWSTLTIPNTITTKSLLVANSANTLSELTLTAGQSVRLNAGGTAFEGYTPGGSGVGGSTGSVDNSVLRSDGTGGSTMQASAVFIDDSGNIDLGTASISGGKTIEVISSDTNAALNLVGKGTGEVVLNSVFSVYSGASAQRASLSVGNYAGLNFTEGNNYFRINSIPATATTSDFVLAVGTNNGYATGNIYLDAPADGDDAGNIALHSQSIADFQDMEGGLVVSMATTAPTAGIANAVAMWTEDVSSSAELFVMNEAGVKTKLSGQTEVIQVALSDLTTALTTGTSKAYFRMPYAFTLTGVRASVLTAPTDATITVDINESGSTILSTKLTIDSGEKTSTTAAAAAVISDTSLADDAEITFDIDQVGSTIAGAGLIVSLIGYRTV